ncbi:MAG: chemotaxis protein CheW [Thermoplasmata archaeon]
MLGLEKYFIFIRESLLFSVPLNYVIEIAELKSIQRFNNFNASVVGIADYRGETIPIVDPKISNPDSKMVDEEKNLIQKNFLIIEYDSFKFAFIIDKFYKIFSSSSSNPESHHNENEYDSEQSNIQSIGLFEKKTLFYLNISHIARKIQNYFGLKLRKDSLEKIENQNIRKDSSNTYKCLCFYIGEIQFAIPNRDILEVVDNILVTPLFKVNPFLRGLINLRGKIYPCVDISAHLKMPYRALNENTKFIIVHYDYKEIAICCDSISNMKDLTNKIIQNNEGLLDQNLNQISFGLANYLEETILLISSRAIIESQELDGYKKAP